MCASVGTGLARTGPHQRGCPGDDGGISSSLQLVTESLQAENGPRFPPFSHRTSVYPLASMGLGPAQRGLTPAAPWNHPGSFKKPAACFITSNRPEVHLRVRAAEPRGLHAQPGPRRAAFRRRPELALSPHALWNLSSALPLGRHPPSGSPGPVQHPPRHHDSFLPSAAT